MDSEEVCVRPRLCSCMRACSVLVVSSEDSCKPRNISANPSCSVRCGHEPSQRCNSPPELFHYNHTWREKLLVVPDVAASDQSDVSALPSLVLWLSERCLLKLMPFATSLPWLLPRLTVTPVTAPVLLERSSVTWRQRVEMGKVGRSEGLSHGKESLSGQAVADLGQAHTGARQQISCILAGN